MKAAVAIPLASRSVRTRCKNVYRIGARWYADTAFINALGTRYPVDHAGFGDFDATVPQGRLHINRSGDAQVVGRLHDLSDAGAPEALRQVARARGQPEPLDR